MAIKRGASRRRADLTGYETIELLIGAGGRPSVFLDEADRRAAWDDHRDAMLATQSPGCRSWAFWRYDAPELRDRSVSEAVQLGRLGLLTEYERRALAGDWRRSERAARRHARDAPAGKVSPAEREAIYRSLRDLYGVPTEVPGAAGDPLDEDVRQAQ